MKYQDFISGDVQVKIFEDRRKTEKNFPESKNTDICKYIYHLSTHIHFLGNYLEELRNKVSIQPEKVEIVKDIENIAYELDCLITDVENAFTKIKEVQYNNIGN